MQSLPEALAPLAGWAQFICWIAVPSNLEPGKMDKFPVDWQTGHVCNAHDARVWTTFENAARAAPAFNRGWGSGVGFVFTEADPFFFLDADKCLQPDNTWNPVALDLSARLAGAACEVSQSGRGLHWFGTLSRPLEHGTKNAVLGLELYTKKRFVALTGAGAMGHAMADCTEQLATIITQFFAPQTSVDEFAGWTTEPVANWSGPEDDDELIKKACASGQRSAAKAFGGVDQGVTFNDLWTANAGPLGAKWPHTHRPFDNSQADQSLANHLAYWTGKDCERMERLMRRSALFREKWDAHKTYLTNTILKACAFVQNVASGRAQPAPAVPPPAREDLENAALAAGRTVRNPAQEYMGPVEQFDHFAGCFFLAENALVYDLTRDAILKRPTFDVLFGGHVFVMDPMGQKTTTSAWDAFTQSRVNIPTIVDDLCFRPELPSGHVVRDGHRRRVNSYVPYTPPMEPGGNEGAQPLIDLLRVMLPAGNDALILTHYLAAIVQYPGRKFQWWPVLQGAEGNGKTFILKAVEFAVGPHFSHFPNSHKLAKEGIKFNAWLQRKLFLAIEEFYCGNRRDFLDEFKVIVTNETNAFEKKGVDETTTDNRANGILCTNHRDAVPITRDNRRYAVFYGAQQSAEDIQRAGLTNAYWAEMWDWFRGRGNYLHMGADYGARVIAHYLKHYPLQEAFDPTKGLAARAPETSSTSEAIKQSLGRVEQEILECIEEGLPGFAGGWVSSYHLDLLIDRMRASVQRSKRRDLMRTLGYDWHPALQDGRVNDIVTPDNRKPKLYVRHGHPSLQLRNPGDVGRAYSAAQTLALAPSDAQRAFG
jgi:hypothetical protein